MKHFALFLLAFLLCVPSFAQTETAKPYYQEDKIEAEIAAATKEIEAAPGSAQLYIKRANLYRFRGNSAAVSADVTKALGISPNDLEITFTAVRLLYEFSERCEQALSIINSTVANHPKNDEAFAWRSRVKICMQDYVGALDDIKTAIQLNPKKDIYKSNEAFLLQKLSQTEDAAERFNQTISSLEQRLKNAKDKQEIDNLKRELMMTYFERSRLFAKNNNLEAMFADLNSAVDIYPIHYAYQTRARAYVWQKMYAEALADLTKAIELNPKDSASVMDRAQLYFRMEKYAEAIADYEQVLKLNNGMEKIAESRIADAKLKMQEKGK